MYIYISTYGASPYSHLKSSTVYPAVQTSKMFILPSSYSATQYQVSSSTTQAVTANGSETTQPVSGTTEPALPTLSKSTSPAAITSENANPLNKSDTSLVSTDGGTASCPVVIGAVLVTILVLTGVTIFSLRRHKRRCEAVAAAEDQIIFEAESAESISNTDRVKQETCPHKSEELEGAKKFSHSLVDKLEPPMH